MRSSHLAFFGLSPPDKKESLCVKRSESLESKLLHHRMISLSFHFFQSEKVSPRESDLFHQEASRVLGTRDYGIELRTRTKDETKEPSFGISDKKKS